MTPGAPMPERYRDWIARLDAYVRSHAGTPFTWGTLDCALFAAGAVEAMTGVDFARGFRGYVTEAGGRRKLRKKGFESHVDLAAHRLPEIAPARAREGDVAVLQTDLGLSLGIVQGRFVHAMGPDGPGLAPRSAMTRAFAV